MYDTFLHFPLSVVSLSIGLSIIVRSFGVYKRFFFHDCSCQNIWLAFFNPFCPPACHYGSRVSDIVLCKAMPEICISVQQLKSKMVMDLTYFLKNYLNLSNVRIFFFFFFLPKIISFFSSCSGLDAEL